MMIEFDPAKRFATLEVRGLDMSRVAEVFESPSLTAEDDREDYGEPRSITVGFLDRRMVILVWTPRGAVCRVISLRKANEREQRAYGPRLSR